MSSAAREGHRAPHREPGVASLARPRGRPSEILEQEEHIARAQAKEAGKPENVLDRIVEGKLNAFYKDSVLLEQPYVKDDSKTIQQFLDEVARQGRREGCRSPVRPIQAG